LRHFVLGWSDYLLENDSQAAIDAAERAVAEDSTFAVAWLTLYAYYRLDNRTAEAGRALDNVMTYLYKLPERQQYMAKSVYYDYNQDPDRQLAVLEMLVEIYPDDRDARSLLAHAYAYRNEMDKAVEQVRSALEFDPYNFDFVGLLVDLLAERARFDEAKEALEAFTEMKPDDTAALVKLGELDEKRGDLDAARRAYDRALIIDPANVEVLLKLSTIETKTGRFEQAQRHCEEALRLAKTPEDRFRIYDVVADYQVVRGQQKRALVATENMLAEADAWLPPLQAQFVRLSTLDRYVQAGQTERAVFLVDSIGGLIAPPLDMLAKIGNVKIYLALEQSQAAAVALTELEQGVKAMQMHTLDDFVWEKKGDICVLEGDYEGASRNFNERLVIDPSNTAIQSKIGRIQRILGRYEEARESIEKRLATHPMDPKAHYELALVYADIGDMAKALEHLRRALDVWQEADPEFKPAEEARDKLKEWQSTTSM
jgi:tetratricopeptide (TPR) repeat protein